MRRARERQIERETKTRSRLGRKLAVGTGAALGATVLFAPAAEAATFTVDTLVDSDDVARCDDDCSLREAAYEANDNPGADTITFASGLTGTIRLTEGNDIDIEEEVTIQGPGADVIAVSGRHESRIFYVDASVNGDYYDPVTISELTLKNGYDSDGGALYSDNTNLTVRGMVFDNNYAYSEGGAVYSDNGKLAIVGSLFTGNQSDSGGGAVYVNNAEGTADEDDVEILVSGSAFIDNFADGKGGALYFGDAEGDHLIESTTISGNEATGAGGGIYVDETDDDGDFTIRNSTISDNLSEEEGGGAYIEHVEGDTLIENSTVSGNTAYYHGGGIYLGGGFEYQTATIRNSTIVDNAAGVDPFDSGDYAGGGVYLDDNDEDTTPPIEENGPVNISSTIIANNSADEGNDLGEGPFADGFVVGFSLIESPSGATIAESPAGSNITGQDPQLGPLANNGGPTETHLPALSSPAIDAGISNGLTTDQRGFPRTVDRPEANRSGSDGTDIGSVELALDAVIPTANCQGQNLKRTDGTESDDTLVGTEGPDAIFGLGGDDTEKGLGGNDCLFGDKGNDTLKGGGGNDLAKGGPGRDKIRGQGGKDKLKGGGGKDNAAGAKGRDKVRGGAGKDTVKGGPGKDKLKGNGGNDRLKAVDGKRDRVNCGGGNEDRATVDAIDRVSANCEKVTVR